MSRRRNRKRHRESQPPPPAALARSYTESVAGMPLWQLRAALSDFSHGGLGIGLGGMGATGTVSDRKGGRDAPRIWSEMDLRGYRVLARHLCEDNPFGIGFLGTLTDYHVRKGYGWQATRKGAKKTPYQTSSAPADPLVAKAQRILDEFRDASKWPLKSREAFRRWVRDGEVIGRWFHGGTGRLPEYRFGEPDALGSPTGDADGDESFGVATPSGDPQGAALDYHFWSDDGVTGEWVSADRVTFAKRGTDTGVKRGVTDFRPVAQDLDDCTTLVRAMMATAIRQAKVAWIEQFPTAAAAQASAALPEYAPGTGVRNPAGAPFDLGIPGALVALLPGGLNPWEPPGAVRKVEGNRQYTPGPTSTGVPGYIAAEQAALRGCGVIWRCPEYFTGDASNSNMASLAIAGSPFTICVESNQYEWGAVWERECALKVLDLATLAGLLTRDERRELDVEVTEPAVVVADPAKDYQTTSAQLKDGVICLDTARMKSGVDPQHEAEGVAKDKAAQAEAQPAGAGGGGDDGPGPQPAAPAPDDGPDGGGDPLAGLLGEAVVSEAARVQRQDGQTWNVGDNWYTKRNGKTVKTKNPNAQAKGPTKKDQATAAKQAKADNSAKAKAAADKLAQGGDALTHDDVRALDDHLTTLGAPEIKAAAKAIGAKLSGPKRELAGRIVAHAKQLAAGKAAPTKADPAAEPAEPAAPHAQARAALDAHGIDHRGLSDDEAVAVHAASKKAAQDAVAKLKGGGKATGKPAKEEPTADEHAKAKELLAMKDAATADLGPGYRQKAADALKGQSLPALNRIWAAMGGPGKHKTVKAAVANITDSVVANAAAQLRANAAIAPKKEPAAKEVDAAKVDASVGELDGEQDASREASERHQRHPLNGDVASATAHADAIVARLKASHTAGELKIIAKRFAGKAGAKADGSDSLALIHRELTSVARLLDSQRV